MDTVGREWATFAVDSEPPTGVLADLQELLENVLARSGAVDEEHVDVVEAGVEETTRVVVLLVQTDDGRHVVLPEVWKVGFRGVSGVP